MRSPIVQDLYWLAIVVMIRLAGWIPSWRIRRAIAKGCGWLGYVSSPKRRQRIAKNLAVAYEDQLTQQETDQIIREYFYEYWREALSLLPAGDRAVLQKANIEGWEHLESALERGKGVILWEASVFGSRNASKQILRDKGIAVHQVHSQNHLGWIGTSLRSGTALRGRVIVPIIQGWMARFVESIVWLRERESLAFTRPLLRVLKRNDVVCSTADGSWGQRLALVEHLGRRRVFATGMVSLAKVSGAALLPLFCVQDRDGIPTLTIGPPIAVEAGEGRQSALQNGVAQWVALFESHVKAHPGKYRAWHITFWEGGDREEGPSASTGPSLETLGGELR